MRASRRPVDGMPGWETETTTAKMVRYYRGGEARPSFTMTASGANYMSVHVRRGDADAIRGLVHVLHRTTGTPAGNLQEPQGVGGLVTASAPGGGR